MSGVRAGDKVLLSYAYCNECSECTSGHLPYCLNLLALNFGGQRSDGTSALSLPDGSKLHGHFFGQSSFSRLAVVNRRSLVKVPHDVPLSLFAPLGCGLQTGAGAVLNTLNVQPGSSVAIFGVGSVGLSAIMASRIRQAKVIIAVDIQPSRLELAKELGATITINSKEVDVVQEIKKVCPPTGVRYALDCSGVPAVIEQMIDSLGTRGRACSVGAPAPGKRASVDVFSHLVMGREYVGCHQGESIAQEVCCSRNLRIATLETSVDAVMGSKKMSTDACGNRWPFISSTSIGRVTTRWRRSSRRTTSRILRLPWLTRKRGRLSKPY